MRKVLVPLVIVLAGAAAAYGLYQLRPEVQTTPPLAVAPLVRVLTATPQTVSLDVHAQGTVLPRTQIQLSARVAGDVVRTAKTFEVGGFFRRNETLVWLDDRDYKLAEHRAQAQVAQAQVAVALQSAEADLAKAEWEDLGDGEATPLTLRQPQVAQAKAALAAAEADLAKTRLDLERTRIVAPFDGRVRAKSVDVGQFVPPGSPIAQIHAVDFAEVRLPIAADQLRFLDLPFAYRASAEQAGPEVELSTELAGYRHRWQGTIVRSEGEVDTRTRMLSLVARIEDPYGRPDEPTTGGGQLRPPLAVGLFVDASLRGRSFDDVIVLPRAALRDNDRVLVVDANRRMHFRQLEILRKVGDQVLVTDGLEAGEKVCISPLDVVADGMEVRIQESSPQGSAQTPSLEAAIDGAAVEVNP